MILMKRDIELMNILSNVKILTIDQITRLFFPSNKSCRNRLSVLRRNGWLEKECPMPLNPNFSIFMLGKNAYKYLGYYRTKKELNVYLEHRLGLNDLYVHVKSSGVLDQLELLWEDGSHFELPFEKSYFKPDAYILRNSADKSYLEYDRATKSLPIIQENLSRYLSWYFTNERESSANAKIRVIYVTPKESRAKAIQRQFETAWSKQYQEPTERFMFYSLTTEAFIEQHESILGQ